VGHGAAHAGQIALRNLTAAAINQGSGNSTHAAVLYGSWLRTKRCFYALGYQAADQENETSADKAGEKEALEHSFGISDEGAVGQYRIMNRVAERLYESEASESPAGDTGKPG
jgi:hypothetical protein